MQVRAAEGTRWKAAGISPVQGTKLLIELSYKTAGGIYGIVGEHRREQNPVESLRAEAHRGYFLSPSSQITLWPVHTAAGQSFCFELCC